jgi:hypothetical protein
MKDIGEVFSYVTERGILSGLYIGIIAFGIFLGNQQAMVATDASSWVALICMILGLIIGNVTYEVLIPLLRWITDPFLARGFYRNVGRDAKQKFPTYKEIRRFREEFMASDNPARLKENIIKDEKLRLMLAYFVTSSIASYTIILISEQIINVCDVVIITEKILVLYILVMTLIGRFVRASSLGRNIGHAYLYHLGHTSQK